MLRVLLYALTIFAGAFLLFQVQPLMGKYILPWFGGGPGVWTTCMLFFQVLLLGGYAYAHFTSHWLKPRAQAVVHVVLLLAALALLPITPGEGWKPHGSGNPTLQILVLLGACLGLPYFVLSTTGPLVQQWFSQANPGRSPYRLYALSNVGSLLALVSYPFFFETHFTRKAQATLWGCGLVAYVICCGFCALRLWKGVGRDPRAANRGAGAGIGNEESGRAPAPGSALVQSLRAEDRKPTGVPSARPSLLNRLLWLLLPACASVLLLATTNKLCQDVAVIPFLWVLPLALYLLSFIICFDNPRWYVRFPFALALIAALAGTCAALFGGIDWPLWKQIAVYSGALFVCCMVCHGELYRRKPAPAHLTEFYLMIAAGGALGGAFVAVAAPALFTDYYELHWGVLLCGLLFVVACATDAESGAVGRSSDDALGDAPHPTEAGKGTWLRRLAGRMVGCLKRSFLEIRRPDCWALLACVLTLLAFCGLDQFIAHSEAKWRTMLATKKVGWLLVHPGWQKGMFTGLRIAIWALLLMAAVAWVAFKKHRMFRHWRLLACSWLALGLVPLGLALQRQAQESRASAVAMSRNFYGVLTVYEYRKDEPYGHYFVLQHGRITHGLQFADKDMATWPTSYYGLESGIGLGMAALPAAGRHIGVVGLGTGSLTAYGRPADSFRIYEINPQVEKLAGSWFTYLTNCQGRIKIVRGDARLSLEREPSQQFDLIALDAFSSDAVPVHLLTREAFEVYDRHLKTNGVIAVNISNHYIDLEPVLVNVARHFNYKLRAIDYDESEDEWWLYASTWVLLTRSEEIANSEAIRQAAYEVNTNSVKVPLWTDDFASLFQVLK